MSTRTYRTLLAIALLSMLVSCQSLLTAKSQNPVTELSSYQCKNDVEVQCNSSACESVDKGFTPMDVNFDSTGKLSVCAYSGCWQGTADVMNTGDFMVLTGSNLEFSTSNTVQDIALTLDLSDSIATIKAGGFSQPLLCKIIKR
ncbi:MAG: hypothetical protein ACI9WC_000443 [Arenicella sp.]|jgi:hypothetical protein